MTNDSGLGSGREAALGLDLGSARSANHIGELRLRRYRAGELAADERAAIAARLADDEDLRSRLAALDDEQAAFARRFSFEHFAGGVERARRVPATSVGRSRGAMRGLAVAGTGIAALAAAILLFVRPPMGPVGDDATERGGLATGTGSVGSIATNRGSVATNRTKGAAAKVVVRIAPGGGGPQREAAARERLASGDRLRVGYACAAVDAPAECGRPHYLVALSIDEGGGISPVYPDRPESNESLAIAPAALVDYLPGGFSFFGSGLERLLVFVADRPFSVAAARQAARTAFAAAKSDLRAPAFDTMARTPKPDPSERPDFRITSFLFEKP